MKTASISTLIAVSPVVFAAPTLTIYNQDLATVRETLNLNLKDGVNDVTFDRATARLIADSVVIRDVSGKNSFTIQEQSYRNDPVSPQLLLSLNEGKIIDFQKIFPDGKVDLIKGKIVRSGYVPGGQAQSPIIEVDGKLRFQLPGEPLFPELGDDSILKPTLSWKIQSPAVAEFPAQLSYLTQGMSWEANYNLVAPEKGETVTLTGWITANNRSGTEFKDASVKLVAGDVNIEQAPAQHAEIYSARAGMMDEAKVTEKAFDDFHLYSLPRPITLHDQETKQIEFLRSPKVIAHKTYVYDPASMYRFQGGGIRMEPITGQEFSKDVAIYWEFSNSEDNGLGVALPAGKIRFYREDSDDSNLEFVGENRIDHTPRNEKIHVYTGNAFDLVGERKVTDFNHKERANEMRETLSVTLKNRSKEAKEIVLREHLWRAMNWEIKDPSAEFKKIDADTIEFSVPLDPDEERVISYTAHYSW